MFLSILLLACFSIEWTRAYVDRAQANWDIARSLVKGGTAPAEIAAGYEWGGANLYMKAVSLGAHPPYDLEYSYPWDGLVTRTTYIVDEVKPLRKRTFQDAKTVRSYRCFMSSELCFVGAFNKD